MDPLTFSDVIQKSFIAMSMGTADRITTLNIIMNVSMSFLVGMFIFYIYKKTYQGVLYQMSFNVSLVMATTVTSLIIMTISGNLILSLGMVGALSIVRFRTPVKDSMDLIFLFWAISVGIDNGVGYFNISIVGSTMIAIFLLFLSSRTSTNDTFLLILQAIPEADEQAIYDMLDEYTNKISLKSKSVSENNKELTIEIRLQENNTSFVDVLSKKDFINRATLISYEQEYSSV
jgi:uncharacterized membrane protein YhiD involved in acid resistance